jgi:hypothetical protein
MLEKKTKQSKRRELETATPNFGQLFSGQPKKLAEIGQFFFLIFEEFRVTKKLAEIG